MMGKSKPTKEQLPVITPPKPNDFRLPFPQSCHRQIRSHLAGGGQDKRIKFLAAAVLLLICFVIFLNTIDNQFVYDDTVVIAHNQLIRSLANIGTIFVSDYYRSVPRFSLGRLYRPLPILSYTVNYWIGKLSVEGYHIVNILLHGAVALLVMWLCLLLFGDRKISFFAALLFAAHPIHTEAVAGIVGRAELLAAGFFILSLIYYIRCQRQYQRRVKYYSFSLLFFFFALLSKENAVTLIGVIFLIDLVFHLKRKQGFFLDFKQTLRNNFLRGYLGFIIIFVIYLLIRTCVLGGVGLGSTVLILDNPIASAPFLVGRLTAVKVFWRYIFLLLFPLRLSCDYAYNEIPVVQSLLEPQLIGGLLLFLSLVLLLIATYRRSGGVFFSMAFFAVTFSIVSNLIVVIGTIMGERLMYLPSLGFCIMLAIGLAGLPRLTKRTETKKVLSCLATVLLVTIMLFYCVRTVIRNNDWQDALSLWSSAVKVCPGSAGVWSSLGAAYGGRGRTDEAIAALEQAVSIFPQYTIAWFNLSIAYERAGLLEQAIVAARKATEFAPYDAEAYLRQGRLLMEKDSYEEAIAAFKKARECDPTLHGACAAMAELYFQQEQFDLAQDLIQEAIAIAPETFNYYWALGLIYHTTGQTHKMAGVLERMVELRPDSAETHRTLGFLYANQPDKHRLALYHFKQSIKLDPNQADVERIRRLISKIQQQLQRQR